MQKLFGVILGAAFAFRMIWLGARQLWTEELAQALAVRADTFGALVNTLRDSNVLATPLYAAFQKLVVLVAGESPWALRFPSVIFGVLSLWVFFRIARLLFGERVAIYASFLLAILPLHYHFSQEAQPFTLFFFLTLLSFDLLFQIISGRETRWGAWLGLTGTLILLFYSGYLAGPVILAQASVIAAAAWNRGGPNARSSSGDCLPDLPPAEWRHLRAYLACAAIAALLFLPWAPFIWVRKGFAPATQLLHPKLALRLIKDFGDGSYFASAVLLTGVVTGARALRQHNRRRSLSCLLVWIFATGAAVAAADALGRCPITAVHFLPVAAPLAMLAGYGLVYVGERLTILDDLPIRLSSAAIVYGTVFLLTSVFIAQSHWRKAEVDWASASRFLQDSLRPGDTLVIPIGASLVEYYNPRIGEYKISDLNSSPPSAGDPSGKRRAVLCVEGARPDPCGNFRRAVTRENDWGRHSFRGLTVFVRPR